MGTEIMMNGRPAPNMESFLRTEGVQFGAGLFETIRIFNRKPCHWDRHMARLSRSASELGLDRGFSMAVVESRTEAFLKQIPEGIQAIKLIWIPGDNEGYLIHQLRENPYRDAAAYHSFKTGLGQLRRNPQSRLVKHKTLNYFENMLERQLMNRRNLHEHILLNEDDLVAEGTVSNVIICRSGEYMTPALNSGILPGTMRHAALEWFRSAGIDVEEGAVTLEDLREADHIYLTNALMGLMPVSSFEGNWYDVDRNLCQTFRRDIFPEG